MSSIYHTQTQHPHCEVHDYNMKFMFSIVCGSSSSTPGDRRAPESIKSSGIL